MRQRFHFPARRQAASGKWQVEAASESASATATDGIRPALSLAIFQALSLRVLEVLWGGRGRGLIRL